MSLARDHWDRQFSEAEEAERTCKAEEKLKKIKTETLYRIDPFEEPKLIDDGRFYGASPRTKEQLEWAEERLKNLGFRIDLDGGVKSYTIDAETHAVYADLREMGKIVFTVVKKPLPKKTRSLQRWRYQTTFYMLDSWKNELRAKFESRLHQALAGLK